jgi:transposase InsO family protein
MNTIMNDTQFMDLEQIQGFLEASQAIDFHPVSKQERYEFIQQTSDRLKYRSSCKRDKGVILRYLMKLTTYSRQQLTRLVRQHKTTGVVRRKRVRILRSGFRKKYHAKDIMLLVKTDEAHDTLSGPATKKLLERAYHVFGQCAYKTISSISIAHLYNLRKSNFYQRQRVTFDHTRPVKNSIAERRKPAPKNRAGYLRIDTVHQGDLDQQKGVYHINAVDEVTQFEIVMAAEKISERFLVPALEMILSAFPFKIMGFHSDNGSEYINYKVAAVLNRMLIKFTKSRSRKSNDNALVECKNGAIVRKYLGHCFIEQKCASVINVFYQQHLNPYLNYHRPCFYPKEQMNEKGKIKKVYHYENMKTPYEKLKSLPQGAHDLKKGMSFDQLDRMALENTDLQAAEQLKQARRDLFKTIGDLMR